MTPNNVLKNNAKISLQGNWKLSIAISALVMYASPVILFAAENLAILFRKFSEIIMTIESISAFILSSIFALGTASLFLSISANKYVDFENFFSAFENMFKAIILNFFIYLFVALWSLLLFIPGIVASYRYKLAFYILSESPELSPFDAIKISKRMTYGNKMRLFKFDLSFIGWFILCALSGGIASLYVIPYYNTALSNLYRELKIEYIDKTSPFEQ